MLKSNNKESIPLLNIKKEDSQKTNGLLNKPETSTQNISQALPKVQNQTESQNTPIFKSNIDNEKFTKACDGLKTFPYIDKEIDGTVLKYRLILPEDQKRTILIENFLENIPVQNSRESVKSLVDCFNEFLDKLNLLIEKSNIVKKTGQGIHSKTIKEYIQDLDEKHEKLVQHSKDSLRIIKENEEKLKNELKKNIKNKNLTIGLGSGAAAAGTAVCIIGIVLSPITAGLSLMGTIAGVAIILGGGVATAGGVTAAVIGGEFFKMKKLTLDQAIKELDKLDETIDKIIQTFKDNNQEFIDKIKESMQELIDDETEYLGAYCLICHDIANDPVIVPSPQANNPHESTTYCKECILKWVEIDGTNPKTREPLSVDGIWMSERETLYVKGQVFKAKQNIDIFKQRLENITNRRLDEINNQPKLNFKNFTKK